MGQYYVAIVMPEDGKSAKDCRIFSSFYFDGNGAKLMEHSYIKNMFTGNVEHYIRGHGSMRVMWYGDYTEDEPDDCTEAKKRNAGAYFPANDEIYGDDNDMIKIVKPVKDDMDDFFCKYKRSYLVNHTQKIYVDMERYVKENEHEIDCMRYDENKKDYIGAKTTTCIDPLPLLTATVNHSGGSYFGINMDDVCSWTWDVVSIEDEPPKGYKEVTYRFRED